jgi:hypothetical protein
VHRLLDLKGVQLHDYYSCRAKLLPAVVTVQDEGIRDYVIFIPYKKIDTKVYRNKRQDIIGVIIPDICIVTVFYKHMVEILCLVLCYIMMERLKLVVNNKEIPFRPQRIKSCPCTIR